MVIFPLIIKMRKYVEIVPVQVVHIESVQILSRSAQTAKSNIAQTITGVLFFHIKMRTDCLLPRTIYEALIRFPCPKPHQMSNIIVISNDLSIIQANVNKSQIVSNSLLNDPELEKCAFLLLTEPWSHMAEESYSVPYIILIVSHFSRRK